jgi:hypothetical protein
MLLNPPLANRDTKPNYRGCPVEISRVSQLVTTFSAAAAP